LLLVSHQARMCQERLLLDEHLKAKSMRLHPRRAAGAARRLSYALCCQVHRGLQLQLRQRQRPAGQEDPTGAWQTKKAQAAYRRLGPLRFHCGRARWG
jgi:hypothetical protein